MIPQVILEPDLPIVDPHHHIMIMPPNPAGPEHMREGACYMLPEVLADCRAGHRVVATVLVGGMGFARQQGPEPLRVAGDTEVANGVAAQCASGRMGAGCLVGAGLVGHADLTTGAALGETLAAHIAAGGGRFRGIRHMTVWSDDPALAPPGRMAPADLAFHPGFRSGFAQLAPLGLSFDAWCYFTQLDGIIDLARSFPETTLIMNHCGGPLGSFSWAPRREEARLAWQRITRDLAACPNVYMKLGGLGMWTTGLPSAGARPPATAQQIAQEQRPYLEHLIDCFGVRRCMFESNFPVERHVGDYATIWNAFKIVTQTWSAEEKAWLYARTAMTAYRLHEDILADTGSAA
ncbi:MAG TPA: amidohydrolase family protein [Novosphingobium sp.]|nr:amidohydrolase family protein [Novosphingobium sp.]